MFEGAGKVVMPQRGSETFISAIGHLDGRINLYKSNYLVEGASGLQVEIGNRTVMDLCMMASKLAYENANVVRNVVNLHWKACSSLCFPYFTLIDCRFMNYFLQYVLIAISLFNTFTKKKNWGEYFLTH